MKILFFISCIVLASCTITSPIEPRQLFNGKDIAGFYIDVPEMDTNKQATSPFIVRNGVLVSLDSPQLIYLPMASTQPS